MIDKSWIEKPIRSNEYMNGVAEFLDFAFSKASINGQILCPCIACRFRHMRNRVEVFSHLLQKGFPRKYKSWYMHGENPVQPNVESVAHVQEEPVRQYPMQDMLNDVFGVFYNHETQDVGPSNLPDCGPLRSTEDVTNEELEKIRELLRDGNQELYQGCAKYSKFSFLVRLYHIKVLCGATDKTFSMIIDLLKDAFPHAKLPASFYKAKKMIKCLGLSYEKIHACLNNCMLYWGCDEDKGKDKCTKCNASRYNVDENNSSIGNMIDGQKKKKPKLAKVLRYFPLIPRLRRLYMCSKTAKLLQWHAMEPNPNGLLRHPRDSKAWKEFDLLYSEFASEPCNIRLALATDGFNPFGTLSSNNSIWLVMLYIYNYPPWYCMKQTSLMMSMIIPGPKMPGNNIDIYLQPLIKELKELWEGVDVYDSFANEMFCMHAALFCTISDFPGLDNLSRWNTYTLLACPSCNFETKSKRLKFSRKNCFMGHRRYLPLDRKYSQNRCSFDGFIEFRPAPARLSGSTILSQIEESRKRSYDEIISEVGPKQWKKKEYLLGFTLLGA